MTNTNDSTNIHSGLTVKQAKEAIANKLKQDSSFSGGCEVLINDIFVVSLKKSDTAVLKDFGTVDMSFETPESICFHGNEAFYYVNAQGASDTNASRSLVPSGSYSNWSFSTNSLPENPVVIIDAIAGNYKVSFNSNGGSAVDDQVVLSGAVATKPADPTKSGSSFVGWYSDSDLTQAFDFEKTTITANTTLYAKWTANSTYTVYFNKNKGTGNMNGQEIEYGVSTALNKNMFERDGYAFSGWNTKANGSGSSYANQEKVKNLAKAGESITLYAQWSPYYMVMFDRNGGSGSMSSQEISVDTSERLTPNKFTRSGYAFAGWNTKANGSGTSYTDYQSVKNLVTAGDAIVLYAQWSTNMPMYRLYNPNSGEHFYTGSEAERVMVAAAGWTYEGIGWKSPASSSSPIYRLYNPNGGDHHYTMSAGERDLLIKEGWNYEGTSWYSDIARAVPVYRAYNPNATTGAHNFTADASEQAHIVSVGWNDEGIAWYGVK